MIAEDLPVFVIANWRGFSGGMRDMFDEVLKFGSYIVDRSAACLNSIRLCCFVLIFVRCQPSVDQAASVRVPSPQRHAARRRLGGCGLHHQRAVH